VKDKIEIKISIDENTKDVILGSVLFIAVAAVIITILVV